MPSEATGAPAPVEGDTIAVVPPDAAPAKPTGLHSPPDSNSAAKLDGSDDSELSDLDDAIADAFRPDPPAPAPAASPAPPPAEDDDIGEVEPDHWSGTVPVFKPGMDQFKDFKKFMEKIDKYGMRSGIVKIIPPQEWKDSLPGPDQLVKTVRVREPIKQDIMGSNGTYRQVNILHQRSYNLPQWRQLCDQSEHQPPAKRGERRANAERPKPAPKARPAAAAKPPATSSAGPRRSKRGRAGKKKQPAAAEENDEVEARPMTPESPKAEEEKAPEDDVLSTVETEPGIKIEEDDTPDVPAAPRRMGFTRQSAAKTQSTSARRKYAKREGSAMIDEAAFKDWDYRMDVSDYTPERCEELERIYWKTLTYAPPLYGADLPGTMFDESTEVWNLNKLPNLLDVLGTKVPGVNTAYLYLGMWKATFAWHLEDVDLYSINYLHFGAPKQWYSISQGDARRFEAAMKNIWPTDAKACDQFLRHKSFLISPAHLLQHYNIKVNKCVSYPGEFVVTYPYGYHSGYNLGYNCAEAVNFALDSWLPMGKIAKKCECAQAQDSVWVDVYEIERKLRGEETEYEETEDEDEEDEDVDVDDGATAASGTVRVKIQSRKRKRPAEKEKKVKKIRLRVKAHVEPPCCLCPNDIPGAEIVPTDDGRKAHRICALYLPEPYIETEDDKEIVTNVASIEKARLELRCMYCRSKRGACFQCSFKKCARAYHATCAAAAGVFVEEGDVPVFGEDGKEYKEQAFEFTCRYHRAKRDKKLTVDALDANSRIREAARAARKGQTVQLQYYRGEIFAGVVVENQHDEQMLLIDVLPNGDRLEVEWKWLRLPDPSDFRLPKASANALPLPTTRKAKAALNAKKRPGLELPRAEDVFLDGFTWAEFHTCEAAECENKEQVKVDLRKDDQVWHYLPKGSTETKPQYTEDPAKQRYNPKSHFLDSIPKPVVIKPALPAAPAIRSYTAIRPPHVPHSAKEEKPYVYKPRIPLDAPPGWKPPGWGTGPPRKIPADGQLSFGSDPFFKPLAPYSGSRPAPPPPAGGYPPRPAVPNAPSYLSHGYTSQTPSRPWPQYSQPNQAGPQTHAAPARPAPPPAPVATAKAAAKPPPKPLVKQSTTPIPPPVIPGLKPAPPSTFQKYAFFQVHHNRDSSRYRTPYNAWGGFTNGYEGNLRAHLMSTQAKKPPASIHKRNGSFGLGGGLTGLTRPKPHLNYNSPPSSSSSSSSPYSRTPTGHSAALSSASSYASFEPFFPGQKFSMHSPPQAHANPFAGSPGTSLGDFEARQQGSSLHPAIRPQFGPVWQQSFGTGIGPFAQAATDVNFSPPSPIATGVLAASPNIHAQSFMTSPTTFATPFTTPVKDEADEEEAVSHDTQTPAEQLKQQLRRISDPPLPSSYSVPHPAIKRDLAAHAPVSSQIPVPMPTPTQAPAPEPQQLEPNLHQPTPRPQPDLNHEPAELQNQLRTQGPAACGAPEPATESMLVQRILNNLRRARDNAVSMGDGAAPQ